MANKYGAGEYSDWVPGQNIPREPNFQDWLLGGLLADGVPIGRGFYTDYVNGNMFGNNAEASFSKLARDRAAWQARKNVLDKRAQRKSK